MILKKKEKFLGIKIEIDLRDEIYNTGLYVDGIEYHPITVYLGSEYFWFVSFENQYIKIFNKKMFTII